MSSGIAFEKQEGVIWHSRHAECLSKGFQDLVLDHLVSKLDTNLCAIYEMYVGEAVVLIKVEGGHIGDAKVDLRERERRDMEDSTNFLNIPSSGLGMAICSLSPQHGSS